MRVRYEPGQVGDRAAAQADEGTMSIEPRFVEAAPQRIACSIRLTSSPLCDKQRKSVCGGSREERRGRRCRSVLGSMTTANRLGLVRSIQFSRPWRCGSSCGVFMQDWESESKTSGPKGSACRWWYHLDSNQGHMDFQSIALPPELWYPMEGGKCRETFHWVRRAKGFR